MNKIPKVIFKYNREKDIDNLLIGLGTVHRGRQSDDILSKIIQQYGDNPSKKDLDNYLSLVWKGKEHILVLIIRQLQEYWGSIEEKYFTHLADRMQLESFHNIQKLEGFLSTARRCGYNAKQNWFAVSIYEGTLRNTLITMHEIMHIFFHKQWWNFCLEQGVNEKRVWDIKEAVSVLLNLWFKNQTIGLDMGYEEHKELRKLIKKTFLSTRNFKSTLLEACNYIKLHPKESPSWVLD